MTHKILTAPAFSMVFSLAFSSALIFSGCASLGDNDQEGARPDWIDGSSSHYPRMKYIIGRGQAEELAVAQDRARANIAKTFQVNVHERSTDIQQRSQSPDAPRREYFPRTPRPVDTSAPKPIRLSTG